MPFWDDDASVFFWWVKIEFCLAFVMCMCFGKSMDDDNHICLELHQVFSF